MEAWVRREALRAAAKVALTMSALTACSGAGAPGAPSDDETQADLALSRARHHDAGATTRHRDAGERCDAGAEGAKDAASDPVNCDVLLADLAADSGEWLPFTSTPDVVACCTAVVHEGLVSDGGGARRPQHFFACCQTPTEDGGVVGADVMACTPWGPPMPPAMDAFEALDALELAS